MLLNSKENTLLRIDIRVKFKNMRKCSYQVHLGMTSIQKLLVANYNCIKSSDVCY